MAVLAAVATAGCSTGQAATPSSPQAAAQPAAAQPAAALPTEQEIAALFDEWNAALATGDPQKVADLYAPNAVLLPTLSNQVRTDRAGIVDYFTKFLAGKPQGKIDEEIIDVIDADIAINTGVYTFTMAQDGTEVQGRYTYAYQLVNGKWLILNHHSSQMPER